MLFIPVCWDLEAWNKYKPWGWQPKTILIPNKRNTISKRWQLLQDVVKGYSRKINKKDDLGTVCVYCSNRTAERLIILRPGLRWGKTKNKKNPKPEKTASLILFCSSFFSPSQGVLCMSCNVDFHNRLQAVLRCISTVSFKKSAL